MSNVVVFGNQKGGVGKSTLSVLYALWLADMRRQSVCFIDLDTQGNASKTLRAFDIGVRAATLFDPGPGTDLKEIAPSDQQERQLALCAASRRLADAELARPDVAIPRFRESLRALEERFETVVIDTPPALGLRMTAALIAATRVVCPIELEEYSIDGVTDMLKTVFGVRQRYNPRLELAGLVLNRFNAHSARQKAAVQQLVAGYSDFVIPARISTRSAIPEALAEGKAVWELGKSSARDASLEIKQAFAVLQERIEPQTVARADGISA